MAKNIKPEIGKEYAICTVAGEVMSFIVKDIEPHVHGDDEVVIEWTSDNARNYSCFFDMVDFVDQENAEFEYHIHEINCPEEFLLFKLKYTK